MRYYDQTIRGRTSEIHIYESVGECVEKVSPKILKDYIEADWFSGRKFLNVLDLKQKVNERWNEGLQVVDKMLSDIADTQLPTPVSRKRRLRWNEFEGDDLDIDRMRSAQPFWRRSQRENVSGPATITLITDCGASCAVKSTDILWRGAAAVVLTKLLEEAGYRVELWVAEYAVRTYTTGVGCLNTVLLKRPQDPLDMGALINGVSGWFFRTVLFGACRDSWAGRIATDTLGMHLTLDDPQILNEISKDEKRIVSADVWSYYAAVRLIRETIESLQPERNVKR